MNNDLRANESTRTKFAIIGCGRVAGNHVNAIARLDSARLVAVCDIVPERAVSLARTAAVPAYVNYHEMLERERVDVVCVVTPSGMHAEHTIDVIREHGVHVVVEKPPALRLDDLSAMADAAASCGVDIYPVLQNRYNKAVRAVREALTLNVLGKIALASVRLHWCRPQGYYELSPWRGTWAMDGGAYTNQGIHYLDLLLHLLGGVSEVVSLTATQLVAVEVEDTGLAILRFASGAVGTIEITTTARPADMDASITILGDLGTAVISGLSANTLQTWTPDPSLCSNASEDIPNAYGFGHQSFFTEVVSHRREGRAHSIPFGDGVRAVELLHALYRSAEDGVVVRPDQHLSSRRLGCADLALRTAYRTPRLEAST